MNPQIESMARRIARNYAYHYRGNPNDYWDYLQEALCVVLEIRGKCDPNRDFNNYARGAIRRHLLWYATQEHAPVHGSTHSIKKLNAIRTVGTNEGLQHSDLISPELLLHSARWAEELSKLIDAVFAKVPDGVVARKVLLDGLSALEVAREHAYPLWRVYRATRTVRKAIRTVKYLQALWKNA